jgi:Icc-related predicted phosphoesterase
MSIRILHTSDLHGNFDTVLNCGVDFDLWLDTGDFFPNMSRGTVSVEVPFQAQWLTDADLPARLVAFLNGRPMVSVGGNHDYVSLAAAINEAGGNAHEATPEGVEVAGIRFAGFRQVPYMMGEWNGETRNFNEVVEATFNAQPDVLVTHAPPAGVLDTCPAHGGGIGPLMTALCYQPHAIKAHFFGHIHEFGGQVVDEMGVMFANGAGKAIVHTV